MSKNKKIIMIISGVVLAILLILAIVIPIIINNNIKKEKEKDLNSINSIIDVISKNCEKELDSEAYLIMTSKYIIEDKKLYTSESLGHKAESFLEIGDYVPDSGIIEVDSECKISLSVIYGDYSIVKKIDEDAKIVEHDVYENGSVVYFNPETNTICDDYVEENSNDGVATGCMKWYTFSDKKKNNILKLILDHNTTSNIRWISTKDYDEATDNKEYSNDEGPITTLEKLNTDTSTWKVRARLISMDEVSSIIDAKFNLDKEESYFFDSKLSKPLKSCYKGDVSECKFGWLYDHTSTTCKEYGCLNNSQAETYGYWTDTASTIDNQKAWQVYFDGRVVSTNINQVSAGIRPVIEIQKSLLK